MILNEFIRKMVQSYGISEKLKDAVIEDYALKEDEINWDETYFAIKNKMPRVNTIYDIAVNLVWKSGQAPAQRSIWRGDDAVIQAHLADPERFVEFVRKYLYTDFNVAIEMGPGQGFVKVGFGDVYKAAKKQPESPERDLVIDVFTNYKQHSAEIEPEKRAKIMQLVGKILRDNKRNPDKFFKMEDNYSRESREIPRSFFVR